MTWEATVAGTQARRVEERGRKSEPKRLLLSCDAPAELRRRLRVFAAQNDEKVGSVIRQALEEYLASNGA